MSDLRTHHVGRVRKIVVAPNVDPLQIASNNPTPTHSRAPTGRHLPRGGSLKGIGTDNRGGQSDGGQSTARSRNSMQFDTLDTSRSVDHHDGHAVCYNMKMGDLKAENAKTSYYNSFEANIIDERKSNRDSTPGRSIKSIRSNPSTNMMTSLVKMASSSGQTMRGISLITDNIAIGGRDEAENVSLLLEHGITHVLNTAHQLPNYFPQHFVYLKIGLLDASSANIVDVADAVVSFLGHIESVRGRVLVHCIAGVSRSVSAVLMHLMMRHRLPLRDAFRYVRSCRPQVCPNDGFKLQLAKLEVQELKYSSVAKDADRAWDFYDWNSIKRSMPTTRPEEEEADRLYQLDDAYSQHQSHHSQSKGAGGVRRGSEMGVGISGLSGGSHSAYVLRQLSTNSVDSTPMCCTIS